MKIILLAISFIGFASQVIAALNDDEIRVYRKLISESGAEDVLQKYSGSAYLFQISGPEKVIDVLVLFDDVSSGGDIFLSEKFRTASGGVSTSRVAWRKMPMHDLSRLLYVIEQSDALSLGNRVYADPLRVSVLAEVDTLRLACRQSNRSIVIERENDDSLPMNYVFSFIRREIIRGLSEREHRP